MNSLTRELRRSLVATLGLALVTGLLYPFLVFTTGDMLFPEAIRGGLIRDANGVVRGSRLLGQGFTRPEYFHPRPSAAGAAGYDTTASGGSNLGPTSRQLRDLLERRIAEYRAENALSETQRVPPDAVTASGSGLDPHISETNAAVQASRVARARGWNVARVQALIRAHTETPTLPFLGPPAVNVLTLNLALDRG